MKKYLKLPILSKSSKSNILKTFAYLLLSVLICIPVFGKLTSHPIHVWDEARQAINAYEMLKNGNYLVTHFFGSPDMWNTKPPLLIWFQVVSMKIFGVSEFAVRLPSALATLGTFLTLFIFSKKQLENKWIGVFAILILVTAQGYIRFHVTRTGDYDALLVLFTTLSGLFLFTYLETKKNKFLYFFFIALALAVLTKSIAGLLFTPAFLIYLLWRRELKDILVNKHFYSGLLVFLLPVLGYYLLRENYNPGYLQSVWENDLGGRYLKTLDNHHIGKFFYAGGLISVRFSEWIFFALAGIVLGYFSTTGKFRRLVIFISLLIIVHLIIISTSKTQLEWYDAPEYPFLALAAAICVFYIFKALNYVSWEKMELRLNAVPYVVLLIIFLIPYKKIIGEVFLKEPERQEFYQMGYFLKEAVNGKYNLDKTSILFENDEDYRFGNYTAHNQFYINILKDNGQNVSIKNYRNLVAGDVVYVFQDDIKEYLNAYYTLKIILEEKDLVKYEIVEKL